MINKDLIYIKQYDDKIYLYNNLYKDGYVYLYYYLKNYENDIKVINLNSSNIIVDGLEESGEYIFYLYDGVKATEEKSIYFKNNEAVIMDIVNYSSNIEHKDYVISIIEELFNNIDRYDSLIEGIVSIYNEIEDKQPFEKIVFYKLILIIQSLENIRSLIFNNNINDIKIENNINLKIKHSDLFNICDIVDISTDTLFKRIKNIDDEKILVNLNENRLYLLEFFNKHIFLGSMFYYQFDIGGISHLWKERQAELNNIESLMINDILIDDLDFPIDNAEKRLLIEEKSKEPVNAIISRPIIKNDEYSKNIQVYIKEFDLLKKLDGDFYLSTCDNESFKYNSYSNKIKITSNTMSINKKENLIFEDSIFVVKDSNNKIISKYYRIFSDYIYDDYEKNKQIFNNLEYANELNKDLFNFNLDQEFYSILTSKIKSFAMDYNNSRFDMLVNILTYLVRSQYITDNKNKLLFFIVKQWFKNNKVSNSLFQNTELLFNRVTRQLYFEPTYNGYVIVHIGINLLQDKGNITEYIESSYIYNSIVDTGKYDFNLIYCINNNDYSYSNFVIINNSQYESAYLSDHFKIEEVV